MMKRIKPAAFILLVLVAFLKTTGVTAQPKPQFVTIHSALTGANHAAAARDTAQAISLLADAIRLGFFDLPYLSSNKALMDILATKEGMVLKKRVRDNYVALQNPAAFRIHTEDIDLFWSVYQHYNDADAEDVFFKDYISKGSAGLQTFYQLRMRESTAGLVKKIRENRALYDQVKNTSSGFQLMKPEFKKAAVGIKKMYPQAVFPPLYFFIGQFSNVGTPDGHAGMLIGTEHLCLSREIDSVWKGADVLQVMFRPEEALPIIVHELIHVQQKNPAPVNLLDYAISEGAADFITYLATGRVTDEQVYRFGAENEDVIRQKFMSEMRGTELDDWLFNSFNPQTKWPGNMAYYAGFKICEKYYNRCKNKRKAIQDILELKDYNQFAKLSGYLE